MVRNRLRLLAVPVFVFFALGNVARAQVCRFTATWQGRQVCLREIPNETVEGIPGAQVIGQVANFQVNMRPPYPCLDGESINVFSVPGRGLLVHNGLQGPQCTYGTWIIEPFNPSCWFRGYWQGRQVCLREIPNETVEGIPGAQVIGQVANFQVKWSCLDGESINVFSVPGRGLLVHNGLQGPQCTYGTWIINSPHRWPHPLPLIPKNMQ